MSRLRIPIALAAVLACGPARVGASQPGHEEVRLLRPPDAPAPEPPRLLLEQSVTEALAPWEVVTGEYQLVERTPPGEAPLVGLLLEGQAARLHLPLPIEPARLMEIRLRLFSPSVCRLQATLDLPGDEEDPHTRWTPSPGGPGTRVASLALVVPRVLEAPYDGLWLDFEWSEHGVELYGIEIVQHSFENWLEHGWSEPAYHGVEDDWRRVLTLSPKGPLRLEIEREEASALELCLAATPEVQVGPRKELCMLEWEGDEEQDQRQILKVTLDERRRGQWVRVLVPLEPFPRGRLAARLTILSSGVVLVAEPRLLRAPREARTVLLITSDTHRGDYLGIARRPAGVATPNIDALAARGVYFENARATVNITNPSHAALLTGTHPRDTQLVSNYDSLSDEAPTLAEAFAAAGWRTWAALSARHLLQPGNIVQGFERVSVPPAPSREGSQTVAALESWLSEEPEESLFVWLHLFDPHTPYAAPEPYFSRNRIPGASVDTSDAGALARGRGSYAAEVDFTDSLIGRILAHPRFSEAVVALTGDHGEALGEQGLRFVHLGLYPNVLDVPLIVAWPGGRQGVRSPLRIDHLGLGRTLLDLAGLRQASFPGRDLIERLDHESGQKEPVFAIADRGTMAAITLERWHCVLHLVEHTLASETVTRHFEEQEVELYDIEADPRCEHNLVEPEFERARRMRAALIQWLGKASSAGWMRAAELDAESRARLAEIGYADSVDGPAGRWLDLESDSPWAQRFR